MDRSYWEVVWRDDDLGFHQPQVNRHLQRFWSRLKLAPESRVLVPLCGKSLDMDWLLSEGHEVIGVDLSEKAQQDYLASHAEPVRYAEENSLKLAWQGRLLFVAGDVFHLKQEMLRSVDAVYDRAALVALPKAVRQNYALFLAQCLKPGAKMLLVTRQAPEARQSPPFNLTAAEVDELYGGNFRIECLHREEREDGVVEEVFMLKRKAPLAAGRLPVEAGESQQSTS
ncbi:thiopurine S-methyltransferase [Marinospirillum alkaliphilum DSM 21637]|uniref:Thiopurine S-methyltransferase n=1 Tax=Marinospirillum alkaliphilum DSM 21637 TaxID=1122209 RepID=A0A1K1TDV0_9GAMM|nr:thiopurine S-methyltransferase [Marinospirillum alkaliphilum DSM 21637]